MHISGLLTAISKKKTNKMFSGGLLTTLKGINLLGELIATIDL